MIKWTTAATAAFCLAASGAIGIHARSAAGLKGSDDGLYDFTTAIFAACPGVNAGSIYAGGGSGYGQEAMRAGSQQVAPMSQFLDKDACTGPGAAPTQSEGLVVGLDGIVLLGSVDTAGSVACNGHPNVACDPLFEPDTGAAIDTIVNGYRFIGWRDMLRVLLAGFDHDAGADWTKRDCNSPLRIAI